MSVPENKVCFSFIRHFLEIVYVNEYVLLIFLCLSAQLHTRPLCHISSTRFLIPFFLLHSHIYLYLRHRRTICPEQICPGREDKCQLIEDQWHSSVQTTHRGNNLMTRSLRYITSLDAHRSQLQICHSTKYYSVFFLS